MPKLDNTPLTVPQLRALGELNPFWQTHDGETCRLWHGDVIEILRRLPSRSVQCVVTSPPYWGLRDYGTATWEGGDPTCEHRVRDARCVSGGVGIQWSNKGGNRVYSGDCLCGARRIDSQLGSEPTPEEYVARMVLVFHEVRRVLRNDGTMWLNLGDTYGAGNNRNGVGGNLGGEGRRPNNPSISAGSTNLKAGNLVGIPWRVALALQADGWVLRQDIIWSKPNPMPESVKNRCTKSHEYVFLLTKGMDYYYNSEAIKEKQKCIYSSDSFLPDSEKDKASGWDKRGASTGVSRANGSPDPIEGNANKKSVWSISVNSYGGAHFATFPKTLIEPMVKAGARPGDIVLDPFMGSGTTAEVALRQGCKAWGVDLNNKYLLCNAIPRIEGILQSIPTYHGLSGPPPQAVKLGE